TPSLSVSITNGLPSNHVWSFFEEDSMWLGTGGGLSRVKVNRTNSTLSIFNFTTRHGLFDNQINFIMGDSGRLWIGCDRGIFCVALTNLADVADGRASRLECITLGEIEGMPSRECNGQKSQPAATKLSDGRLVFCTTKGLAIVEPRRLLELAPRPRVLI